MTTALANHLWQSTAVLLAAWALAHTLRHHRAAVRHALWLAAGLKFLVPLDALVELGRRFGSGAAGATSAAMVWAFEAATEPFSHPAVARAAAVVEVRGPEPGALPDEAVLLAVWSAGFLLALLGWRRQWVEVAQLAARRGPNQTSVLRAFERVQARDGPITAVALVFCNARVEPGIFGIWRPRLLWPRGLTEQLSAAEIEAILAHELCHVRRRDNLTGAIYALIRSAFWFYPVLRLVGNVLHLERERACDEEVLRRGYSRRAYAEGIVKTCEFCVPTHAMAAGATGSLRARVTGILCGQVGAMMGHAQRIALAGAAAAAVLIPVAFGVASAPYLRAVTPARAGGSPAFEAASVTPADDPSGARILEMRPDGRVSLRNLSVRQLIVTAYQTQDHLVVGGPAWVSTAHYDVVATVVDHAPTPSQMLQMLRTLLADRFGLVMHRERREVPIYNLVQVPDARREGGLKPTACVMDAPDRPAPGGQDAEGPLPCGVKRLGAGRVVLAGHTLDSFANGLAGIPGIGRSVVNRTGLEGRFDVELSLNAGMPDPDSEPATLSAALEAQLGLRLVPTRGPVEILVIDSLERPMPH